MNVTGISLDHYRKKCWTCSDRPGYCKGCKITKDEITFFEGWEQKVNTIRQYCGSCHMVKGYNGKPLFSFETLMPTPAFCPGCLADKECIRGAIEWYEEVEK